MSESEFMSELVFVSSSKKRSEGDEFVSDERVRERERK